ncbi:Protein phosphatase 1 regulatory subunit 37 [Dissostichus eleginoides]|uniref:Protein phosphatase 1 regulatory subunit 37 n=1 Tax=Dissostichus eleginoides TaxID=100907 RepID=A0AAD9C4Y9_DISEL|nr:Protein phosphatase 1 regulatory subunit 37 [Dissostichus eleginoides]
MTHCSDNEEQSDDGAERARNQKKRSKGEKRVSFPPDGQIVSGFAEHRDREAESSLTLTEVMEAYEQSCSRHQVQPREQVLQQLQTKLKSERDEWRKLDSTTVAKTFLSLVLKGQQLRGSACSAQGVCVGGGVKCLDLKGERLDQRSCEALEAVLKSLHFDFINLQAAQLEENGAASLLDMMLYYESTTHLDISDNSSMGTLCWRALAHLIKQSVRLSRLDVCNVAVVDYPAQSLSKALLTSRLTELHLHNAQLSGVPLYTLVSALKWNRALQQLHLTNNLLNSYQDALHLGDLLRYNTTLHTLELSSNAVADDGLEELCDGLRWQTAGVRVLLLRNNQITARGMVHLAKALPLLRVLQVLDLGENLLGNEGMQVIREPLMNCSLLQLGLAQASITCEGAVALAEFLAESRQIQRLDLRHNELKVGGLMALCLALRINSSLEGLDLDHHPPHRSR